MMRRMGNGLAALTAAAQMGLLLTLYRDDFERSAWLARDVLLGHPHWRVFQNRILGPLLAEGLAAALPTYVGAHIVLATAVLTVAGVVAWRLGERVGGRMGALLALLTLHTGFALLLMKPAGTFQWIFLWDFLDLLVFMLFVEFVAARRPTSWFVALSLVGVLNHEISVFIALWLVADPLVRWMLGRCADTPSIADSQRVLAGGLTVVAAMAIVECLRTALFVEGTLVSATARTSGGSFHFALSDNIATLVSRPGYGTLVVLGALGAAAAAVATARRDPQRFAGLCVIQLALIASLLTFGVLLETRIYVVLIPVVVLSVALPRGLLR